MLDAETLLLVHNDQTQILKLDILGQQAMGADGDIDLALRQVGQRLP